MNPRFELFNIRKRDQCRLVGVTLEAALLTYVVTDDGVADAVAVGGRRSESAATRRVVHVQFL